MRRLVAAAAVVTIAVATVVVPLAGLDTTAKALPPDIHAVTVAAADFHPVLDSTLFANGGDSVRSNSAMYARIPFPDENVLVTSIKVRAFDNSGPGNLCARLRRSHPATGTDIDLTNLLCTTTTAAEDPQTMFSTVFTPVGKHHVAYLHASFGHYSNLLELYGATVFYRITE